MVTRNPANHPVCRIGFVGTGGVATRHAQVLSGFEDVTLVAATDVDRVIITWPSGQKDTLIKPAADQVHRVKEAA